MKKAEKYNFPIYDVTVYADSYGLGINECAKYDGKKYTFGDAFYSLLDMEGGETSEDASGATLRAVESEILNHIENGNLKDSFYLFDVCIKYEAVLKNEWIKYGTRFIEPVVELDDNGRNFAGLLCEMHRDGLEWKFSNDLSAVADVYPLNGLIELQKEIENKINIYREGGGTITMAGHAFNWRFYLENMNQ